MITVRRILHTLPTAYEWKVNGKMVDVMHKAQLIGLINQLRVEPTIELPGGVIFVGFDAVGRREVTKYLESFI